MSIVRWNWWFVRALFLSFVCAYFSIRICKRNVVIGVVLSVVLLYTLSLTGIIPNKILNDFIFIFPFFCTGIVLKKYEIIIHHYERTMFACSAIIFTICMFFWQGYNDSFYDMNTSMLEPEGRAGITGIMVPVKMLYRFVTGVSGSLMLWLFAKKMAMHLSAPPYLLKVGQATLGIYILHGFAFKIFTPPINHILFDNHILSLIVCLIVSLIIMIVANWIIQFTSKSSLLALLLWGKQIGYKFHEKDSQNWVR